MFVVLFLLTYKLGDALMLGQSKTLLRELGVSTAERGVTQRLRDRGEHRRGDARSGVDRPHLARAGDRADHDPHGGDRAAVHLAGRAAAADGGRGPGRRAVLLRGLDGALADDDHGRPDHRAAVRRHGGRGPDGVLDAALPPRPQGGALRLRHRDLRVLADGHRHLQRLGLRGAGADRVLRPRQRGLHPRPRCCCAGSRRVDVGA